MQRFLVKEKDKKKYDIFFPKIRDYSLIKILMFINLGAKCFLKFDGFSLLYFYEDVVPNLYFPAS